jgi:hypothetical protein
VIKGYRLVAQSLLPIKFDTLIYGSKDGGVTIHSGDKDPEFKPLIEGIAKKMNLKGHLVSGKDGKEQMMHTATDVEIHKVDGKYYALDFARLMPPEAPLSKPK